MAGHFVRGGVQHNILQQREQEQKRKLFGESTEDKDETKVSASGWGTVNKTDNSADNKDVINSKFSQYSTDTSKAVEETQDKTLEKYQEKLAEASVRLTQKATAKIIKEAEERQRERNNAWMDRSAYNEEQARRRYDHYGYDNH